jgi:hypothetical protein
MHAGSAVTGASRRTRPPLKFPTVRTQTSSQNSGPKPMGMVVLARRAWFECLLLQSLAVDLGSGCRAEPTGAAFRERPHGQQAK